MPQQPYPHIAGDFITDLPGSNKITVIMDITKVSEPDHSFGRKQMESANQEIYWNSPMGQLCTELLVAFSYLANTLSVSTQITTPIIFVEHQTYQLSSCRGMVQTKQTNMRENTFNK